MSRYHTRHRLTGRRWKRLRKTVLDAAGWRCQSCARYGNEVDHIEPLHRGGAPWATANLQVLCAGCHAEKTRQENRRELTPSEADWQQYVTALIQQTERGKLEFPLT